MQICPYFLLHMKLSQHYEIITRCRTFLLAEGVDKVCGVALQKDTEDGGRKDEACGEPAPINMAGLCE